MPEIAELDPGAHEALFRVSDAASGLLAFIAIHSTRLGPAAGGLRMRRYADEPTAITDVLRLSEGMTYKNAAADLPLGGGKAVIIGDPRKDKSPGLLRAFGEAVQSFAGRYWTAEDMGMTTGDMATIAGATEFVAGLPDGVYASGDPSPVTALGVLNGIRVALRHKTGRESLAGRRVAVQGLGSVGRHLCGLLREAGADLLVSDVDRARVAEAVGSLGANAVAPECIAEVPADILAPCAIGGTLTAETIGRLTAQVVAGAANNQLPSAAEAEFLHARGTLYAPDFIVNGGGIINVAAEICRIGDRPAWVNGKLAALSETLDVVLAAAADAKTSPHRIAMDVVSRKLGSVRG